MRMAAAVALLWVVATPLHAQDWKGQGRLAGRVTDTEGHPLKQAEIALELPGRGGTQLHTDAKGQWAVLGLASGTWNVDITAEGHETKRLTIPVSEERRLPPVEVKLASAAPAPKAADPAAREALAEAEKAFASGQWAEARTAYQRVLALRPDLGGSIHLQIARTYSQEKAYALELDELQQVVDTEPANNEVRRLMAMEALAGGLFDRAEPLLAGLDEQSRNDPDLLYNAAVAYFNHDRRADAITFLTRALAVREDPDALFLRGQAYLGSGDTAAAKKDFQRFLEKAPDDPRAAGARTVVSQIP